MPTPPELRPGLPVTEGALIPTDATLPPCPLKHTAISAAVIGPITDVRVTQQFHNTHSAPVEAIYAFPLPQNAAVTELALRLGERVITSEVRERAAARREYEDAREAGQGAAVLEQERPNLFAITVANIQPDEQVEVMLRFQDRVPYDDGQFTLTFPTVVLPRYTPEGERQGGGNKEQFSALNPPLLPQMRDGHTLSVTVEVDAGRLTQIGSPSHEIDVQTQHGRSVITLRQVNEVPNKDFVLRYRVAGEQFNAAAFTYRVEKQSGTVLLMVTPKAELAPEDVLPREVLFVFDRSGSMGGDSIAQARNALRACLRALNPGDTFNIFPFDDKVEQFAPASLPFTQASVDRADDYIAHITARGGTEILVALQHAMGQPRDDERVRLVVFLTDGAVGNEDSVLRELRQSLGGARVFAFGVGSAVNHFLLDKLAAYGRGNTEYILPGEPIEEAVQRFQNRAAFPVLVDVALDWGAANVVDTLPTPLPDLYAGQPLVVLARYYGTGAGVVKLTGRTPRGPFTQTLHVDWPVATPDRGEHWAALGRVWARAWVDALMTQERDEPKNKSSVRDEIIGLALMHALVTPYTSLVAVEQRRDEHAGRDKAEPVIVPIHLPAGTHREAFEPQIFAKLRARAATPMHAMQMPSPAAPPMGQVARGGGFLKRIGGMLGGRQSSAPAPAAPYDSDPATLAPFSLADLGLADDEIAALGVAPDASAVADTRTPAERYDAALRFLARTQNVNGSWADAQVAAALALLAFVRGGHTDRAGSYRPQLTRTVRWLVEQTNQPHVAPVVAWALAELAMATSNDAHATARDVALKHAAPTDGLDQACLDRAQGQAAPLSNVAVVVPGDERGALALALLATTPNGAVGVARLLDLHQQQGATGAGAVVPSKGSAATPDAAVFAATAAGALAWHAEHS